jgi:hypothetical protein
MIDAVAVNRVAIDALAHHHDHGTAVTAGIVGAAVLLALAALAGCAWRPAHIRETLALAACGAICVALASYLTWNPNAGSATCPGKADCDVGYGMGACILAVGVFVPMCGAALLGRSLRRLRHNG